MKKTLLLVFIHGFKVPCACSTHSQPARLSPLRLHVHGPYGMYTLNLTTNIHREMMIRLESFQGAFVV